MHSLFRFKSLWTAQTWKLFVEIPPLQLCYTCPLSISCCTPLTPPEKLTHQSLCSVLLIQYNVSKRNRWLIDDVAPYPLSVQGTANISQVASLYPVLKRCWMWSKEPQWLSCVETIVMPWWCGCTRMYWWKVNLWMHGRLHFKGSDIKGNCMQLQDGG